jgi:hypothetical protein
VASHEDDGAGLVALGGLEQVGELGAVVEGADEEVADLALLPDGAHVVDGRLVACDASSDARPLRDRGR